MFSVASSLFYAPSLDSSRTVVLLHKMRLYSLIQSHFMFFFNKTNKDHWNTEYSVRFDNQRTSMDSTKMMDGCSSVWTSPVEAGETEQGDILQSFSRTLAEKFLKSFLCPAARLQISTTPSVLLKRVTAVEPSPTAHVSGAQRSPEQLEPPDRKINSELTRKRLLMRQQPWKKWEPDV